MQTPGESLDTFIGQFDKNSCSYMPLAVLQRLYCWIAILGHYCMTPNNDKWKRQRVRECEAGTLKEDLCYITLGPSSERRIFGRKCSAKDLRRNDISRICIETFVAFIKLNIFA